VNCDVEIDRNISGFFGKRAGSAPFRFEVSDLDVADFIVVLESMFELKITKSPKHENMKD
jgi:hypothetical protein